MCNRPLCPKAGHAPFENAALRTKGRSGDAAAGYQIGWQAAALGRVLRSPWCARVRLVRRRKSALSPKCRMLPRASKYVVSVAFAEQVRTFFRKHYGCALVFPLAVVGAIDALQTESPSSPCSRKSATT